MKRFSYNTRNAARTVSGNRFGYAWPQWLAVVLGSLIIIGSQV